MVNTSHEPGPWVLGGCSGRMITTPNGYVGDGFIADVDTLANAKLIAAAPELLEALQDMLNGWKYIREQHGELYGVGWDRAQDKAEKAISKALGQ